MTEDATETIREHSSSLERETRVLAAALIRREAQDRADHQASRAASGQSYAHLADHQQRFQMWIGGPLNSAVRRADMQLRPARCGLALAQGRWSRFCRPVPPAHILTESRVTLTRDGSARTHGLTVTVQADGTVRASRERGPGRPREFYVEVPVAALGPEVADRLITSFITDCLAPPHPTPLAADRQAMHRMFR